MAHMASDIDRRDLGTITGLGGRENPNRKAEVRSRFFHLLIMLHLLHFALFVRQLFLLLKNDGVRSNDLVPTNG